MCEMRLLVFGESVQDSHTHLQAQLIQSRNNPLLNLLFQRASEALRHEIALLSPAERRRVKPFNTIDELHGQTAAAPVHAGIQNALLCLSHLADYIE